jgi:hypothetical protein
MLASAHGPQISGESMSDHFDTEDSRTDICDLYVFPSPTDGDRSVLVLDVNPDASALEPSFDPAASYELKIDTDGDLEADVAFHVLFAASPVARGRRRSTGQRRAQRGEPVRRARRSWPTRAC